MRVGEAGYPGFYGYRRTKLRRNHFAWFTEKLLSAEYKDKLKKKGKDITFSYGKSRKTGGRECGWLR
jgi:hypothetical protein